jgi:membrane associated rhomboid family serine protease
MFNKGAEKTQQSPRIRRGFFAAAAALYAIWMVISFVKVILGKGSIETLLGLPGGILLLWLFSRAANKVRTPS